METQAAIVMQSFVSTFAAQTQTVEANSTATPRSTVTKSPTPLSLEDVRAEFISAVIDVLENGEGLEDIETVTLVRFRNGALDIEIRTIWASRDNQPIVSYNIISFLAPAFENVTDEQCARLFGSEQPVVHITSYSTDGDYRYESVTTIETLRRVAQKSISYEEWVAAANAGFR
jgi:hypothetical protein